MTVIPISHPPLFATVDLAAAAADKKTPRMICLPACARLPACVAGWLAGKCVTGAVESYATTRVKRVCHAESMGCSDVQSIHYFITVTLIKTFFTLEACLVANVLKAHLISEVRCYFRSP